MKIKILYAGLILLMSGSAYAEQKSADQNPIPLEEEELMSVVTLQSEYPDSWLFAHDVNFFSLTDGKVILLDLAAKTQQYKGMMGTGLFSSFKMPKDSSELYIAETYYSRGTRGERTDVLTIYDKSTLKILEEIILPGGKRAMNVPQKGNLVLTRDGKFILLFNFTPAASVSVIDVKARKILNEIFLPGCSLIYPTGEKGFSSLCGNGTLASFTLDDQGKVVERQVSEEFNNIDDDPLFMKEGAVKGTSYFPTFLGQVRPVDFSGKFAKVRPEWSLLNKKDRAEKWRPAGWQVVTADEGGRLYVLMQKDAKDGSHKDGGSEVWVYNVKSKKRIQRITLKTWGVSIEVTRGSSPYLAVTNGDFDIDVYKANEGKWLHMIGGRLAETPFLLHATESGGGQ